MRPGQGEGPRGDSVQEPMTEDWGIARAVPAQHQTHEHCSPSSCWKEPPRSSGRTWDS